MHIQIVAGVNRDENEHYRGIFQPHVNRRLSRCQWSHRSLNMIIAETKRKKEINRQHNEETQLGAVVEEKE